MKQTLSVLDITRKQIQLEQLKYVEGSSNYSILHLTSGRAIMLARPVSKMEVDLASFVRIHKRYLVNPRFVILYQPLSRRNLLLPLTTGETLRVSRRRVRQIMAALALIQLPSLEQLHK